MSPQTIFITGASRGLGLEFVKHILSQPSKPLLLLAACRNPSRADELQALAKENENLKIIQLDVTKDEDIASAYETTNQIVGENGLNLLINNAGINQKGNNGQLLTQTREKLVSHYDTNAAAPVLIVKQFLPLLKKAAALNTDQPMGAKKAAVVNISSIMSSIEKTLAAVPTAYHYRASKAALNMLTATMSMELKDDGILVSAIHPGWVQTDMGGANANLKKDVSVQNCWSTIESFSEASTGKLFNYDGSVFPW